MAQLLYPYYSLGTSMLESGTSKKVSKSLTAINLPDMPDTATRNAVAADLIVISRLIARLMGNTYAETTLTTREEADE